MLCIKKQSLYVGVGTFADGSKISHGGEERGVDGQSIPESAESLLGIS